MLLREAAKQYSWKLNYGSIALMWRGGCIIRSVFLGNIKSAFDKNESLENLLLDHFFTEAINQCQQGWRKVVATATVYGVPIPCLSTGKHFSTLIFSINFSIFSSSKLWLFTMVIDRNVYRRI